MTQPSINKSANRENLRQLCLIRAVVLLSQISALIYLVNFKQLEMATTALYLLIAIFALVTTLTFLRLQKQHPITDLEFFSHLIFDIGCLSLLAYFSGGASNPFISYLLVPTCISAATLPWAYTWLIAIGCVCIYSLLLFFHVPLQELSPHHGHHHHGSATLNLHIIGMWCNFAVSAFLITYFVVRMAKTLREQDEHLNKHKEENLRNEQIMAVATLAAGTAHELGTPLSTMKVLLHEIEQDYSDQPALQKDIQMLNQQIEICKSTLHHLVDTADKKTEKAIKVDIQSYFEALFDRWRLLKPQVKADISIDNRSPSVEANLPATVEQSIINLLNNAADASPEKIVINLEWNQSNLQLTIRDFGPGIPPQIAEQLGKPFLSTKEKGLGLGLFLTHATMARYGGSVKIYNKEPGALTELNLPIQHT